MFGGKVDSVTGVNYFSEDSTSDGQSRSSARHEHLPRRGRLAAKPMQGRADGNTGEAFRRCNDTDTDQNSHSYGWFNSLTWHATDKFNLTVGARLAHDKKAIQSTRFPSNGDLDTGAGHDVHHRERG